MRINIFKKLEKIKNKKIRYKVLDKVMSTFIPFNRGLGYKITELSKKQVTVISPDKTRRQNHLKGAHACALALLGEYPAGLLLAQSYSPEKVRLILSELKMDYRKQGRGQLTSVSKMIKNAPKTIDEEAWFDMTTEIHNSSQELIAICHTKWQLKSWEFVKSQKN